MERINVEIVESLFNEINKKFKKESITILKQIKSLEKNPDKGKFLSTINGILIKELKHKQFKFYFIKYKNKIKITTREEIIETTLRFIRMSDKKHQQEIIDKIKDLLRKIEPQNIN